MKNTILILLTIIISASCYGQRYGNPELIKKFIDDNMGKKVGNGVCYELPKNAYGDKTWLVRKWGEKRKYRVKSPRIGDCVDFTKKYNHVGVVYEIKNDGTIVYAEQNTKGDTRKSIVILSEISKEKIKEGKIRFYRFN